jgi:hypothetical protein
LPWSRQEGPQHLRVVFLADRKLLKPATLLLSEKPVRIVRIDDGDAASVKFEMAEDERQRSASDGAKADEDHRPMDNIMATPVHSIIPLFMYGARPDTGLICRFSSEKSTSSNPNLSTETLLLDYNWRAC